MLITLGSLQLSGGQRFFKGAQHGDVMLSFWLLFSNASWLMPASGLRNTEKMLLVIALSKHIKLKYKHAD